MNSIIEATAVLFPLPNPLKLRSSAAENRELPYTGRRRVRRHEMSGRDVFRRAWKGVCATEETDAMRGYTWTLQTREGRVRALRAIESRALREGLYAKLPHLGGLEKGQLWRNQNLRNHTEAATRSHSDWKLRNASKKKCDFWSVWTQMSQHALPRSAHQGRRTCSPFLLPPSSTMFSRCRLTLQELRLQTLGMGRIILPGSGRQRDEAEMLGKLEDGAIRKAPDCRNIRLLQHEPDLKLHVTNPQDRTERFPLGPPQTFPSAENTRTSDTDCAEVLAYTSQTTASAFTVCSLERPVVVSWCNLRQNDGLLVSSECFIESIIQIWVISNTIHFRNLAKSRNFW